jgi:hypothetical protein
MHGKSAHATGFIGQGIARVIVKREVDDDRYSLARRVGELCLARLPGRQQAIINLTKVPRVVEGTVHGPIVAHSNLRIAAADIHGMSSPEDRLMKAVYGKTEVMYDRRQKKPRRSGWRGGRRESDWAEAFGTERQKRPAKPSKMVM